MSSKFDRFHQFYILGVNKKAHFSTNYSVNLLQKITDIIFNALTYPLSGLFWNYKW